MRLAACYTVYNGLELLEDSINAIKNHVDEIIICYQRFSNYKQESSEILDYLKEWEGKYTLIEFIPKFSKDAKYNEKVKHQKLIDEARRLNCSHFFLSATDHFYESDHIDKAIEFIKNNPNIMTTYTKMITYFKTTTLRLEPLEAYYMPFICSTKVDMGVKSPVVVDPSCAFTPYKPYYVFPENEVIMHHYSWIRKDIRNKLENAAAKTNWKNRVELFIDKYNNFKLGDTFPYYPKHNIVECEEVFKLRTF